MKINHAIVHVFDFLSCVNTFAHEEIDIADKTAKNYIARHVRKALGSIDNKHGEFSADSLFAPEMRRYFAGERDFVDLSCQIGDYIVGELSRMEKSPSTDLLVVDFEDEPERQSGDMSDAEIEAAFAGPTHRYFAIMLLERLTCTSWGAARWASAPTSNGAWPCCRILRRRLPHTPS